MDLSLDEIIMNKNNSRFKDKQIRNRLPNKSRSIRDTQNGKITQSNGKLHNYSHRPLQNQVRPKTGTVFPNIKSSDVADARLKIIQKNRLRLTDARDKLSELAKQTDARTKIKSRRQGMTWYPNEKRERVQQMRTKSERISLHPLVLQRSIQNTNMKYNTRAPSSLIRCTINRTNSQTYEEEMEVDSPGSNRSRNNFNNIQIVTQNEHPYYQQEYKPRTQEPIYVDHYEQPVITRQFEPYRDHTGRGEGRMSQKMRARLDTPAKLSSEYSLAPASHNSPQSQEHRIVVSNLHSSVTNEDIKELFEDIGPLLDSRVVRTGTAEVVYKFQSDAQKAVDAYHNRQLDGQPMKCLRVIPGSSPVSSGVLRSHNMPAVPKFPVSSKSMVVPDLSAIHKALFANK